MCSLSSIHLRSFPRHAMVAMLVPTILAFLCVSLSSASTRLTCLQDEQGKEVDQTPWQWGSMTNDRGSPAATERWMYSNPSCPLELFDERKFCQEAIGCGKKLLLVGDSTMRLVANTLHYLIPVHETTSPCPTHNYCSDHHKNPNSASTCVRAQNDDPIKKLNICLNQCPPGQEVVVTYIRHDFLINIHGMKNLHGAICEHWKAAAVGHDYVAVSIGPHFNQMINHPFGRLPPADFNLTAFIAEEAQGAATLLGTILNPNATLIYRTGPVGNTNSTTDCNKRPVDKMDPVQSNFNWDKIPALNTAYITTLRDQFRERLLVMDTLVLNNKMVNCRADVLHFIDTTPQTPILQEWLILYNLLLEHKAQRGA